MDQNTSDYNAYLAILKEELIPALGCTEPIALAYAAAKCRQILGCLPSKVLVMASTGIIKNVKSVIIPNTNGLKGMQAAVAAGIVAGNPEHGLEVLQGVDEEKAELIRHFMESTEITVKPLEQDLTFDIVITAWQDAHYAKVRVANSHSNVVLMEKDSQILLEKPVQNHAIVNADTSFLNMNGIWEFSTTSPLDTIAPLLERQIAYNMEVAEHGLHRQCGANIGSVMIEAFGDGISNRAAAKAAAASDARMSGCEMPVIINSGSGNQGITCSLPVIEFARELGSAHETLLRALLLSNLITIYQKSGIGKLSAFCGAVSAGAAAGAGIAYLKGGGLNEVLHTVTNALAVASGMVCDGAKASCAAKIALSVQAGILGYEMFVRGQEFYGGDGIIAKGADNTIQNIIRLGRDGMKQTDQEIINIMMG